MCQIAEPNQTVNICHVSEDISVPHTRINLRIASLESCFKAGRFEYNKAYILQFIFFSRRGGGSGEFLGANADTQNSNFSVFDLISISSIYKNIDFHLN